MRIIGGRMRGLGLASVGKGDVAAHLRPTSDRVRESLFSILEGGRFGDPVDGAQVLDLFAGTGALGFEALSRGADHVSFVENGRVALKLLADNIAKARVEAEVAVHRKDATRIGACSTKPATLVFLDPPYGKSLGDKALVSAAAQGWIAKDALIVWEEASEQSPPPQFSLVETKRYGETWLTFLSFMRD
ncbi:16S rRNA (guanine(966)-N(2))-methyltransferase RsmD [Rhodobacteraceae bacterium]|nr:16S rRNA (guanine(966)-N(2))-methyltransferase RsmD [Paracoccaceae bacterium]